ncbi:MAG: hypothetical protein D3923_09795, partial [Candidatus Electrothrix sp. AR3]|nr:hypothetical protein [Candidatus Electrothrix sp. AR3]
MTTFNVGDLVEVQVDIDGQLVWAIGEIKSVFGNRFMASWSWNGWSGTRSFDTPNIRTLSAEKLAQIEADRKAVADLKANLRPEDDVQVQVNINGQTVWALGKFKSLSGDSFKVAYAYQVWRGTTYSKYPAIRLPSA